MIDFMTMQLALWGFAAVVIIGIAAILFAGNFQERFFSAAWRTAGASGNKRLAKRFPTTSTLRDLESPGSFSNGTAALVNISSAGACITTRWVMRPGERIRGRLQWPTPGPQIAARVVWMRTYGGLLFYGIQFESFLDVRRAA